MPIVNVNGAHIFYEMVGSGPAIVYIHGGYGGASSTVAPREEQWVSKFQDSYTVVTYDRRSAGRSEYTDVEHTLDLFVDDLRELIEELGIEKLILVGSSAGGPIALKYALKYQDSLIALVLPNTSARVWSHSERVDAEEELRRRYSLLKEYGPEKTFDILNSIDIDSKPFYLLNVGPNPRPPGIANMLAARELQAKNLIDGLSRENKISYYIGELRNQAAYLDSDLRESLCDINIPTLLVHGDLDTQVPYNLGKELSEHINGSEFVTIPGAGHGIMQWDEATSAIKNFCDRIIDQSLFSSA